MMNTNKRVRIVVLSIVIFALQEVILRILFPLPELENFDRTNYSFMGQRTTRVPHLGSESWYWSSLPDTTAQFIHEMNQYGFRGEDWEVAKGENEERVLFVGGDYVEGIMAQQHKTIANGFIAGANDQTKVLNGGMMGVGIGAYLKLLTEATPVFKPDYVFLFLSTSDLGSRVPSVPQVDFEERYFNLLVPRFWEMIRIVKLGGRISPIWKKGTHNYLPAVPARNNPWSTNSAELEKHIRPDIAKHMRNGDFNPFRTNEVLSKMEYLKNPLNLGETFPYLQYFTRKHKMKLVVCYVPARELVTDFYYQYDQELCLQECQEDISMTGDLYQVHRTQLQSQCEEYDIPFIDFTDYVREYEMSGNHQYWKYDGHMKGQGYLQVGRHLYNQWKLLK